MKRNKLAQIALEYMMITGIISIIVIPTTFLFFSYASESVERIDKAQIDKFATEVITTAETVSYLGSPSRIVIKEQLPSSVESISVNQDPASGKYFLNIDVRTREGVFNLSYPTEANIKGLFEAEDVAAGIKMVRVEAGPVIGGSPTVTVNLGEDVTCNDGTVHNMCSTTKPLFCFNNVLIDHCEDCGCSSGTCQADGTCQ
tara:strand:+ start:1667 stop:2269 length:603 start_codon:yes stop_codon:yes gene_type:complete